MQPFALNMTLRNAFWLLVAGIVCLMGFLAAMDAWNPGDATAATIAFACLAALWGAHAVFTHRHHADVERDPALRHARERRGF